MRLNKRAQVDVALTIGSIIVPLGAIFGALIFAWAMIGPINDAGKLAAVISYDVATLSDVAYSVPDFITIWYTPPSQCKFAETKGTESFARIGEVGNNYLICLNGFMNITGFNYRTETKNTVAPDGARPVLYSLESTIGVALDPSRTTDDKGDEIEQPFIIGYPSFGNIKDFGVLNSPGAIPLVVKDSVEIKKSRSGLYDTIYAKADVQDPLKIVSIASAGVCTSKANMTSMFLLIPPGYHINAFQNKALCLDKESQHPDISGGYDATDYTVYCFDFTDLAESSNCIFNFDGFTNVDKKNSIGTAADSSGTCALMNITIACKTSSCSLWEVSYAVSTHENEEPRC